MLVITYARPTVNGDVHVQAFMNMICSEGSWVRSCMRVYLPIAIHLDGVTCEASNVEL